MENQLIFHIQGGTPQKSYGPRTLVGSALPEPNLPNSLWEPLQDNKEMPTWAQAVYTVGEGVPDRPYDKLLMAMFRGQQSDFVGTEGLLSSWRVWDNVLHETAGSQPFPYEAGFEVDRLLDRDLCVNGEKLTAMESAMCEEAKGEGVWFRHGMRDEL